MTPTNLLKKKKGSNKMEDNTNNTNNTNKIEDAKYNGYKNRATWNAVLWFNNDEPLYRMAIKAKSVKEIRDIFRFNYIMFKDFFDENAMFKSKLVSGIDWQEVYNNTGNRS
jgi:hypothetical protein